MQVLQQRDAAAQSTVAEGDLPDAMASSPLSPDHNTARPQQQQQQPGQQEQGQHAHEPHGKQQEQEQPAAEPLPLQLKIKRVLRGDATRSFIMRPSTTGWSAVSQVCLQHSCTGYDSSWCWRRRRSTQ